MFKMLQRLGFRWSENVSTGHLFYTTKIVGNETSTDSASTTSSTCTLKQSSLS